MTAAIGWPDPRRTRNAQMRLCGAILLSAIWCLTLILPAYAQVFDRSNGPVVWQGYKLLGSAWIALAYGQTAWLANPALMFVLVSLFVRPVGDRATRIGAIATVAAMVPMIDLAVRPAFNGYPQMLIGGWLWLANNLAAAGFAFVVTAPRGSVKA